MGKGKQDDSSRMLSCLEFEELGIWGAREKALTEKENRTKELLGINL